LRPKERGGGLKKREGVWPGWVSLKDEGEGGVNHAISFKGGKKERELGGGIGR